MTAKVSRWLNWQPKRLQAPESAKSAESGNFVVFVGRGVGHSSKIEGQCVSHRLSHESAAGSDRGDPESQVESETHTPIIRKGPRSEPSKPTKPSVEELRASALAFVNRAAARIVCPDCYPGCPSGTKFAVLVPAVNATPEFREALDLLGLQDLPVLHRDAPLGFRPEVEHELEISGG